jgi:hypothetical protein
MFMATYPASFLSEDRKGFHVRFPDFPEALTGGDDLEDTQVQAADCRLKPTPGGSPAGTRFLRPPRLGAASISLAFRSILDPSWPCTLRCANAVSPTPSLPGAWV